MILCLFFTRGVSLEDWLRKGLLDREKKIYEKYLNEKRCEKIFWITYGKGDLMIANILYNTGKLDKRILILPIPKLFNSIIGKNIYSFLIPFIFWKNIKICSLLKTNQMDGCWSSIISKIVFRKKLIIRTGYTLSIFKKASNKNRIEIFFWSIIEFIAYYICDQAIVASIVDKNYVVKKYSIKEEKVNIIGNYVDISLFKPTTANKYCNRILFVGRLNKEKNLFNLIIAIKNTNYTLDIYGEGSDEMKLRNIAKELNCVVNFNGIKANDLMPEIINKYNYFILPSFYEGTPKALLEAMACGLICIGTNIPSISAIITNKHNGLLINGFDIHAIKTSLNIITNVDDFKELKENAVEHIKKFYSLESYYEKEFKIFQSMI